MVQINSGPDKIVAGKRHTQWCGFHWGTLSSFDIPRKCGSRQVLKALLTLLRLQNKQLVQKLINAIDEVDLMGCVLPAGASQSPTPFKPPSQRTAHCAVVVTNNQQSCVDFRDESGHALLMID